MPRPKNKEELVDQNTSRFNELMDYLDSLPDELLNIEFNPGTLNRNIRDVIAHLHHWHLMMISWYEEGMNGKQPKMPAEGHTWRTVPLLNQEINLKYNNHTFYEAKKAFQNSHYKILNIISIHTNDELFTKKKFKWTGSTSLGAYLISSTCSHYDWATKLIKKSLKAISLQNVKL